MFPRFPQLLALAVTAWCLRGHSQGDWLRLGLAQELGRNGRVESEDRTGSDLYSESILRVGLSHPALFLDGKGVFDPVIGIVYTKYKDFTELDGIGFDVSGPLTLQFEGVGDESDSLKLSAGVSRDTGAVSTWNSTQATSTVIAGDALYTRHWGSPRWTSELGYRYYQRKYDDAIDQYNDSTIHTPSAAVLYSLSRSVMVGLRTMYAMENFDAEDRFDTNTWDIAALTRWQITGKVKSELALGHETISYDNGGDDSGVTVRGALDYQITPRWACAASARRYMEPADTPDSSGGTTTAGDVRISYRFTPKLTGRLAPRIMTRDGEDKATEYSLGLEATYAFQRFDMSVLTRVTDRDSEAGGDDSYTAWDVALRFEWASDRASGGRWAPRNRDRYRPR
jgi:hypothetical protein